MRRVILAGLLSTLAMPNTRSLTAQTARQSDSTQPDAAGPRLDSVPMTVRVTSRKLPFMPGDLLMMNCSFSGEDGSFVMVPWACARRTTGTLERLDPDSVAFVRGGRTIRLAARDVKKLEQLIGRSALRTAGSSVMGGLTGVAGATMIGIGGGYKNDAAFVGTAVALGTIGAIIGGVRGGSTWTEVPRTFEVPPAQRR
jgi:hypothetical protein